MPKQFGPTSVILYLLAISFIFSSRSKLPASLKPAEITIAPLTPNEPASFKTSGTTLAGTAIITKSIFLATELKLG